MGILQHISGGPIILVGGYIESDLHCRGGDAQFRGFRGYPGVCLGMASWSVLDPTLPAWRLSLGGAVPPTLGVDRWH